MVSLDHFGLTDAGKVRQNNEDALLSGEGRDPALFAVADGIGGFEAGEVASSMVVESLERLDPGGPLPEAIQEANRRIHSAASADEKLAGMGTTIVAVRLQESGEMLEAEVSHVGDSRLYLLRDGQMKPLTEDHSLVAELVRSGSLTRAQASEHPQKNLITRALGAEDEVEVDSSRFEIRPGDRLILCSDGLPDMVPESRVSELASGGQDAEESARSLVSAALSAGGTDNVTVVVVDVNEARNPRSTTRSLAEGTGAAAGAPSSEEPPVSGNANARSANAGSENEEEGSRRSGQEGVQREPGAPSRRPRRGRRRSRGIFSRRRGASGGRARRSGEKPASGAYRDEGDRDAGDRSAGDQGADYREGSRRNGSQEQESLIPGVWEGVGEEEPEPREPTPEEVVEQFRVREPQQERRDQEPVRRRRRKRLAKGGRFVATLVRGLAALALIAALLVPPYLWWSTRYYMTYDNEEIVVHQGVPYDFLGNELNRVDRRTGVMESDIAEPYRDQIRDNRLYTEDRLQTVLEDLQEA